jgi:glycosyltransferase involved in cell wall biosynthesis
VSTRGTTGATKVSAACVEGRAVKRIGIVVVAYNAASTLTRVLDRIPRDFAQRIDEILIGDDASEDSTFRVALGYQRSAELPLRVIRSPRNLGYGGNQKVGYRWAMEHGLDIVVLLHGDGQYAPELLPAIIEPLELDRCDAVLGSRMLTPGAARRGGMPLYKYFGNRVLTRFENAVVGTDLSEWHSGYRAYRVDALREIPFEQNSDGFDFDTQIILQLLEAGKQIVEIPIPTYYGDEICYVNGVKYARDVARQVLRYRAHKIGVGSGDMAFASPTYDLKVGADTSHGRIVSWLGNRRPARVLDVGCSSGALGGELRARGHEVVGVDVEEHPEVRARVNRFVRADLDQGLPGSIGDSFDVIVAADVLEHVRRPDQLLGALRAHLAPGGTIIACVPNFGHWYPRLRVLFGRFDYDRRGILDQGHVRFFTLASFERLVRRAGFAVRRREFVPLPTEVAHRGAGPAPNADGAPTALRALKTIDRAAIALRPTLFAYQLLYELEPITNS